MEPFVVTRCGDEIILSGMAVKTEKELSETQRSLWLKAVSAIELHNFGYAISLLQEILKQEPEFLTGRQLLRRAEVTKTKSAKKSFFSISTAPIAVMKAQREYPDLRPARGYGRFFQSQICLPIVRLLFQNLFQHFDRARRIFFNFSLRPHDGDLCH